MGNIPPMIMLAPKSARHTAATVASTSPATRLPEPCSHAEGGQHAHHAHRDDAAD
jgi:hypothetical protein